MTHLPPSLAAVRTRLRSRTAAATLCATCVIGSVGVVAVDAVAAPGRAPSTAARAASAHVAARQPLPRLTAVQLRARAVAAMRTARTVRVIGSVLQGGKRWGVDLQVGANATGTLTYTGGGSLALRRIGTSIYLRPDDAYYTTHGHADLIGDRHGSWIEIGPDDGDYAGILPLTQVSTWTRLLGTVPAARRKPAGTFSGIPTVAVIGGRAPKGTITFLATRGATLPAYAESIDRLDHLAFLRWNQAFTVVAPGQDQIQPEPGDDVLDIPKDPVASATAFGALWRP